MLLAARDNASPASLILAMARSIPSMAICLARDCSSEISARLSAVSMLYSAIRPVSETISLIWRRADAIFRFSSPNDCNAGGRQSVSTSCLICTSVTAFLFIAASSSSGSEMTSALSGRWIADSPSSAVKFCAARIISLSPNTSNASGTIISCNSDLIRTDTLLSISDTQRVFFSFSRLTS